MDDLIFSPIGPALILLASGVLLRLLPQIRRSSLLAIFILVPLAAVFLLLVRLRVSIVPDLQVIWWPLVITPLRARWILDGWNWLMTFLLLVSGTSAALLTWRLPGLRASAFHGLSLLVLAGAALTVVSGNLLVLSAAWVATDVLLVARSRGGRLQERAIAGGLVAVGSLLLFLAIGITDLDAATASLVSARLPAESVALLLVVAALRMAAYPFHAWLMPGNSGRDRGTQLLLGTVGIITGGWLLGEVYASGAGYWFTNPVWQPLLVVCVLGAGTAAWASSGGDRFAFLTSSRSSWIWLSMVLAGPVLGRSVLAWALVAAVFGLSLVAVGIAIRDMWRWRVPLLLSIAVLAGVPLFAGFAVRALAAPTNLLTWLLVVLAEALAISCVIADGWWPDTQDPATDRTSSIQAVGFWGPWLNWPMIRMMVAFGLLSVPVLLWGIQPAALASLVGFPLAPSLGDLLAAIRPSQWLALGLALALAVGLAWAASHSSGQLLRWRSQLARFTGLGWALDGVLWAWSWAADAARPVFAIVEGEGYWGWVLLVLLLAWSITRP